MDFQFNIHTYNIHVNSTLYENIQMIDHFDRDGNAVVIFKVLPA